eukprot:CAMPEP_0198646888 /NCGR_PEP_ID=MMETSP1467-20131203/2270_1 /TAXON_ID=1462469 /ORGANISM="unid. sp., Strain CCMP2135" /LENGTH=203 /DNA_ID=CAMNT_0044382473 /DNA_START=217 /DNA_END=828 /DNA_ORIENTATION=+
MALVASHLLEGGVLVRAEGAAADVLALGLARAAGVVGTRGAEAGATGAEEAAMLVATGERGLGRGRGRRSDGRGRRSDGGCRDGDVGAAHENLISIRAVPAPAHDRFAERKVFGDLDLALDLVAAPTVLVGRAAARALFVRVLALEALGAVDRVLAVEPFPRVLGAAIARPAPRLEAAAVRGHVVAPQDTALEAGLFRNQKSV